MHFAGLILATLAIGATASSHPEPGDAIAEPVEAIEIDVAKDASVVGSTVEQTGAGELANEAQQDPEPLSTVQAATAVHKPAGPAGWRTLLAQISEKYDISPKLLEAVVWQESRWHAGAVSPAGARGLAQLMPGTAGMMGVDPDDPIANLEGGARYLRMQLDAFDGDLEKALAAYNAGPARVIEAGGIPNIRETEIYVASIMSRLAEPVQEPSP